MKSMRDGREPVEHITLAGKGRHIVWTPDLQTILRRCLAKITERFREEIRAIAVSLEDVNGPRGGIDKRCRLDLILNRDGRISVSADSAKVEAALTQAVARAKTALLRRSRHPRRDFNRIRRSDSQR